MWCLPAQADGEFVYHMEDVLEVYQRPYDPLHPTVCMDELMDESFKDGSIYGWSIMLHKVRFKVGVVQVVLKV